MSKRILFTFTFIIIILNSFASDFNIESHSKSNYSVNRYTKTINTPDGNQILLYVYYPVKKHTTKNNIYTSLSFKKEYGGHLKKRLGDSAANLLINAKANFSYDNAIIDKKFPVVFFSAGLSWSTLEYTYIIHNIVESGKIVIAINTNYTSAFLDFGENNTKTWISCDDKYKCLSEQISFVQSKFVSKDTVFNRINNNVNLNEQIFIGHSLGGAASLLSAHHSKNVVGVINLDGDIMKSSLDARPTSAVLFLNQIPENHFESTFESLKADSNVGWRYEQMEKTSSLSKFAYYISIKGMYHSNFQDYALLNKGIIPNEISKTRLGPIDGKLCLDLCSEIINDFIDQSILSNKELKENYPTSIVKKIIVKK